MTVTATGLNGSTSVTNFNVIKNDVGLVLYPLEDYQLNQSSVSVYGEIGDSSLCVWVNGVKATVYGDGTWEADAVPVSPVGTASLSVQVYVGDPTLVASQNFYQPQPVAVGLTSYAGTIHEDWESFGGGWFGVNPSGTVDDVINWYYLTGGNDHYHATTTDPENPPVEDFDTAFSPATNGVLPAFFNPPWEYAQTGYGWNDPIYGQIVNGNYSVATHVMLEPSGQALAGQTNLYLVRANASEVADVTRGEDFADSFGYLTFDPSWWYGTEPLPPDWLQIEGQTLVNSGITNTDGSVSGEIILQAPAGVNVDVTPVATQIYQNWDYTFNVQANEVNLQLALDANHDGNITFDAADQTMASQPYRFWVNDNHDGYGSIWNLEGPDSVQEDLDPSTGNDATSNSISCTRDLEDYTRLWLNVQGITNELRNGTFLLALQWEGVTGSPAIRIFPAAETNGGTLYLTDTNAAQAQITAPFNTNMVDQTGQSMVTSDAPFFFTTNFWSDYATNPITHLLFDGVSAGSGKLVLAIYKNDGMTKLAESQPLYLSLNEITNMYESWTVGEGNGGAPSPTATLHSSFQYTSGSLEANQYILFVHGWNMTPEAKDEFANAAYKRLWWQGYKGRFGAFRWPTEHYSSWVDVVTDTRNYDDSESNAWASATGLASLLSNLNTQYGNSVYLFAHSMGNVVAGEALKLLGTNQVVNTYIACQAAVSAHGYDPDSTEWESNGSTPDIYANYPTNGEPSYFSGVASVGIRANFYNANDWALNLWRTQDQSSKPDHGITSYPGYYYSTPSGTHPSGFYKIVGSGTNDEINLLFPTNNYEILAYCVQSYSYALGATASVDGFTPLNLTSIWPADSYGNRDYGNHCWHSAEFLFSNAEQQNFWSALMLQFGFIPTTNP